MIFETKTFNDYTEIYDFIDSCETILKEVEDIGRRWSICTRYIVEDKEKNYWQILLLEPKTERQEIEDQEWIAYKVLPFEKTITEYKLFLKEK